MFVDTPPLTVGAPGARTSCSTLPPYFSLGPTAAGGVFWLFARCCVALLQGSAGVVVGDGESEGFVCSYGILLRSVLASGLDCS